MEALAERLSQLDTQAEGALRVVLFYDTLIQRRVDLPALAWASAALAECDGRSAGRSVVALALTRMTGAMAAMFLLLTLYMSSVMEYSPLSVGIAYPPLCAVLVAALAASAPLVTRHGHRPAAYTAFGLAAAGLLLLSRVPAHDADALDLLPAMPLVALGLGLGLPAPQGTAPHGSAAADAGLPPA